MSHRVKEGCWVGILTILHAIFTVLELGKMPIVIFRHMQATGGMAFVLWTVYGVALYFVVLVYEKGQEVMIKDFFRAVCFGGSMAVVKGIIDTVGEIICKIDYRYIPIEILMETLLFGVILFFVLHFKVANKKIVFDLKKISAPAVGIAIVLVMYIIQACNKLGNYIEYQHYATTEVELNNLDTYVAHTILFHNVWAYVVLYILLWWFMQRITVAKEIKDC